MQIASVRRSLFNNAERAKFLSHLVDGVKRILENPQVSISDAVSGIVSLLPLHQISLPKILSNVPLVALGRREQHLAALFLPFHHKPAPLVAGCHVLRSSAVSQFFSSFSPLRVCQTQITTMSSADCWPDWKAITSWESWWRWRTTPRSSDSLPTSPWPACRYKVVLLTLNGCLCPSSSLETKL